MYIIMLGAPGSGKGTIGKGICDKFNLVHLSTGDIFRDEINNPQQWVSEALENLSHDPIVTYK